MTTETKVVENIPLKDIHCDEEFNCRGKIIPMDVQSLAQDIERQGLIQPVTIAPYSEEKIKETGKKYRLIAGYRRFTAHRVLERDTIEAIVRKDMMNDIDARFYNLAENLQRADLDVLQEAKALKKLKDIGIGEYDCAERLGASRGWVQIRYMLLDLPKEIQLAVQAKLITQTHVRELYSVLRKGGETACFEAAKKIKEAKAKGKVISVNPKPKPAAKRHRKRPEIFEMLDHVIENTGTGLHTRCLAWAAGEISDIDLYESIKVHALENGKTYVRPTSY